MRHSSCCYDNSLLSTQLHVSWEIILMFKSVCSFSFNFAYILISHPTLTTHLNFGQKQLKFNLRKNTFLQKKQNLSFKIYLWKTIFITFHKTVICIPWCQKHFALQNISFYICYNFLKCGYEGPGLCLQLMSNIRLQSQTLMEFRILWQNIIWNIVINNSKTRFRYLLRLWGILM